MTSHDGCERQRFPRTVRNLTVTLRLHILVPLRAWRGDAELATGPRQQLYLLALRLARQGRPITSDELVDLIWPDAAPASAFVTRAGRFGIQRDFTRRQLRRPKFRLMGTPVVFIHGLWIHSVSWDPWRELFASRGYAPIAPGWPGDGDTVAQTRANPGAVAGFGIEDITDAYAKVLDGLDEPPIVIGHSFGGLIAEKLLDCGLARAVVAISPAPIKGIRALPFSLLRSSFPLLSRPANKRGAVALTEKQFRYSFGNALPVGESAELYRTVAVPGPGRPLFEASSANFTRNAPTTVDTARRNRGPLLLVANGKDHTVPAVVVRGAHKLYAGSGAVVDLVTYADRGHSAPFDHGWCDVAEDCLAWLVRQGLGSPMAEER